MRYCGILALVAIICSIEVALSEGFFSSSASMALVATRRSQRRQQQQSPHAFNGQNKVDRMSSSHRFCLVPPGGASKSSSKTTTTTTLFVSKDGEAVTCPFTKTMTIFGSLWGSFGVIYILAKAVKRVIPIAMEPFGGGSLTFTPFQWSLYAMSCLFFAYAEGYKGFHLKFSPLVVKRSFTLVIGTPQGNNPLNYLLAPLYSMGLFCATKKRLITSWGVTLGVAAIVAAVKRLPLVPRCIVDAGVIAGLTLGSISILYHFIRSVMTGQLPNVDACLPGESVAASKKNT